MVGQHLTDVTGFVVGVMNSSTLSAHIVPTLQVFGLFAHVLIIAIELIFQFLVIVDVGVHY